MVNATLTVIPLCFFCSIITPDQLNNLTSTNFIESLQELQTILADVPGSPDSLAVLLAAAGAGAEDVPKMNLRSESTDNSIPKFAQIISGSPLLVRQAPSSTVQELLAPLTNAVGNLLRRRPQPSPASAPAETPQHQKAVHNDHHHAEEVAKLPEGIVSGGFFYEGTKANGQYFNEEKDESDSIEVHSHDEVSPGKLYDGKREHPYYVVDRPAEGPAPAPLTYFTSGFSSGYGASDAIAKSQYQASVEDYNRKLKAYTDYYYPYSRMARNMELIKNFESKAENIVATVDDKKQMTGSTIDRILQVDQAAVV